VPERDKIYDIFPRQDGNRLLRQVSKRVHVEIG
jgi:hypothetical protein